MKKNINKGMGEIMTNHLVLCRGISGSGKSTYAKSLNGYIHLEADMYFMKDGDYNFNPSKLKEAHEWCQSMTRKHLEAGHDVVVSNTFVKRWEIQPYIDLANELGVPYEVKEMKTQYQNVHGVPEEVLNRMKANWEEL